MLGKAFAQAVEQVVEKCRKSHKKEMEYWRSRTRTLKQELDLTQNYLQ